MVVFTIILSRLPGTHCVIEETLPSTPNSVGGPTARMKEKEDARTPRAPARDFVPCTPGYEQFGGLFERIVLLIAYAWYVILTIRMLMREREGVKAPGE